MSKKNSSAKRSWLGRLFFGGSKGLADDIEAKRAAKNDVEEIVSPVKQIVRGFMERKLAVGALCVVIAMFLLVFIGPLFMTTYTDTYTEVTQANLPPTMSMLSVPSELKNDIKMIDSYGSFSVGLSNAGKVSGAQRASARRALTSPISRKRFRMRRLPGSLPVSITSLLSVRTARSTPGAQTSSASTATLTRR